MCWVDANTAGYMWNVTSSLWMRSDAGVGLSFWTSWKKLQLVYNFFFFHVIWHDSWNTDFLLPQAQRYITQLKSQINSLEAELEEQRAQKQRALVENEQLRMELEAMRRSYADHDMLQNTFLEAESKIFIQH